MSFDRQLAEKLRNDFIAMRKDRDEIKAVEIALAAERAELRAEVERLKADNARLDWMEKAKCADFSEGVCGWTINGWDGPYGDTLREAIDAAMKGDA
jgi:hypothetical protein